MTEIDKNRVGYSKAFDDGWTKYKSKKTLYNPKYFKRNEFKCPCCGQEHMNTSFVMKLDDLREKLGNPIRIASGYRCTRHNQKVRGAVNSPHVLGLGADIKCDSAIRRREISDIAFSLGFYGIGIYDKHIHLDDNVREHGKKVLWSGKSK